MRDSKLPKSARFTRSAALHWKMFQIFNTQAAPTCVNKKEVLKVAWKGIAYWSIAESKIIKVSIEANGEVSQMSPEANKIKEFVCIAIICAMIK